MTDGRFKLFRDLFALTGGQLVAMLAGFLAFAYLARTLEPEAYGALEYAVGLSVIFAMVIDWGLGPVAARSVVGSPAQVPDLAALVPTARLAIALLAVPAMGLSAMAMGHDSRTVWLVWLYALALLPLSFKQDWLFQGLDRMAVAAAGQPLRMVVFAAGVFVCVGAPGHLTRIGYVEIAATSAMAVWFLVAQSRGVAPVRMRFSPGRIQQLTREGFWVGLTNVVWALIQYLPVVIVTALAGAAETAWLGASLRIVVAVLAVCVAYHFNLYPAINQRLVQPDELARLLGASIRATGWLAAAGALAVCLLAPPVMALTFGDTFADAGSTLAILIWAAPATLLSGHVRWTLIARGRQRHVLAANVAGLAAAVGGSLILAPVWGSPGAAAAIVAATLAVWAVAHRFGRDALGGRTGAWVMLRPFAGALLAGAGAWWAVPDVWLRGLLAVVLCLTIGAALDRSLPAAFRRLAAAKNAPAVAG